MENDNEKGLYNKYEISKSDGSPMDQDAQYFVLRIDLKNSYADALTLAHRIACRKALREYAKEIHPYLPKLSEDIMKKLV